jgi:acetoacetyl-CoA synthetase
MTKAADAVPREPIWRPTPTRAAASNMRRFIEAERARLDGDDYAALYRWSIQRPAEFWAAVWKFCDVRSYSPYASVVRDFDRMPGARWFEGATLNFADNLLPPAQHGTALVFHGEDGDRRELSWGALRGQVGSLARALESFGVGPGDRVAGFMPNCPETVVAMLATASLGAIWTACSADFGVEAVLQRFTQIAPKVLFAADRYLYAGKRIDRLPAVERIVAGLPGLAAVVVVPYRSSWSGSLEARNVWPYEALAGQAADPRFRAVDFRHPLYVLYSSGTTGEPKCIVHGVGGTLIQHKKEHVLHTDIRAGDVVFYYTTCGWMMWHWLVSTLASGATVVLFDGSPWHPDPGVLWRMAEHERVNVFGTSARYLSGLAKSGYAPRDHVELPALRSLLSTGSPLAPSVYDFVYRDVKSDVELASISGGTDLIALFAAGNPLLPVYRGELQCRALGMKVEIFDANGRSLRASPGELVCTAPFPSMPLGFWNDPGGRKYHAAYFERFPGVWSHGDYAELTDHDGLIIHGRSDAVLNPGGVRIGTAEIYTVVERFAEVAESVAVGQAWNDDVRVLLFVRMQPGASLNAALAGRIRDAIREQASPRHVPAKIIEVADIPRTISGKIVELAVRDAVHGRDVANAGALANPEALEQFRGRRDLTD